MSDRGGSDSAGIGMHGSAAGGSGSVPHKTSDMLIHLAETYPHPQMTIGDLVDGLSDRAFGMLMLVLALPCTLPAVLGIPQVVSVPLLFVAAQIVMGRHKPWLPQSLRVRSFSREAFLSLARRAKRYVGWVEAFARPRLSWLTRGVPERIFGVFLVIFSASVAVPLPLTNTVPAVSVALVAIGFVERDGLLVILGTLVGFIWVSFLVVGAVLLVVYGFDIFAWLRSLI